MFISFSIVHIAITSYIRNHEIYHIFMQIDLLHLFQEHLSGSSVHCLYMSKKIVQYIYTYIYFPFVSVFYYSLCICVMKK